MLTEDYVSFETAKLLKEKGFDEACHAYYDSGHRHILKFVQNGLWNNAGGVVANGGICVAPTLQMAMKWLREVHKLHIEFVLNQDVQDKEAVIENYYHFNVSRLDRFANEGGDCEFYNSYEEACEEAIRYCLENLI